MTQTVRVTGINSYGEKCSINYMNFKDNDFEAIKAALEYADDEWSCKYDDNGRAMPETEYKCFEKILTVELLDE